MGKGAANCVHEQVANCLLYTSGRAADVKDISERLISILKGGRQGQVNVDEPVIILADDLAPVSYTHLDVYKRQACKCYWYMRIELME